MYLKSAKAIRESMLYRPMLPGEDDILFTGAVSTDGRPGSRAILRPEVEHLTCFIGGMVGMGAKVFDIKGDLEIAEKLTEGCVWAYGSMPSGIMAEGAVLLPCQSLNKCAWNETAYNEHLDPRGVERDRDLESYLADKAASGAILEATAGEGTEAISGKTIADIVVSRDLSDTTSPPQDDQPSAEDASGVQPRDEPSRLQSRAPAEGLTSGTERDPNRPQSHKEYVAAKIANNNLPLGYVNIRSKKYSLRYAPTSHRGR